MCSTAHVLTGMRTAVHWQDGDNTGVLQTATGKCTLCAPNTKAICNTKVYAHEAYCAGQRQQCTHRSAGRCVHSCAALTRVNTCTLQCSAKQSFSIRSRLRPECNCFKHRLLPRKLCTKETWARHTQEGLQTRTGANVSTTNLHPPSTIFPS